MNANLLILRSCRQEKRRPRTSLNHDLVELAASETVFYLNDFK